MKLIFSIIIIIIKHSIEIKILSVNGEQNNHIRWLDVDADIEEPQIPCTICSKSHPRSTLYVLDNCNHRFSVNCLQKIFHQQIFSKNPSFEMKIVCPDCKNEVTWRDLRNTLSSKEYCKFSWALKDLFLQKFQETKEPKFQTLGNSFFFFFYKKLNHKFNIFFFFKKKKCS